MDMNELTVKTSVSRITAVLSTLLLLALSTPVQQAYSQDDESINVSCYKGNLQEGNYIGDITVNRLQDATQDCNTEYEDCQGVCLGCVIDSNGNQDCYNSEGNKVSPE